jgi:hypothetical protein
MQNAAAQSQTMSDCSLRNPLNLKTAVVFIYQTAQIQLLRKCFTYPQETVIAIKKAKISLCLANMPGREELLFPHHTKSVYYECIRKGAAARMNYEDLGVILR